VVVHTTAATVVVQTVAAAFLMVTFVSEKEGGDESGRKDTGGDRMMTLKALTAHRKVTEEPEKVPLPNHLPLLLLVVPQILFVPFSSTNERSEKVHSNL